MDHKKKKKKLSWLPSSTQKGALKTPTDFKPLLNGTSGVNPVKYWDLI